MRSTKLRRRSRVFRRRHVGAVIGKICLWLLVIPALIGGYYLAGYLFDRPQQPAVTDPSDTVTTAPSTTPTVPSGTDTPSGGETDTPSAVSGLRGVWMPTGLLSDPAAYADTLTAAADAGYNAVIVDVKDADGRLWYISATELAVEAHAIQSRAVSIEQLQQTAQTLQNEYRLTLVPRVYAFRDNTAPRYLETARISLSKGGGVWYDNDPAAGGRRWLNPYAADARRYIVGLVSELKQAGFSLTVVDGIEFPSQETSAYYGEPDVLATPRGELLTRFSTQLNEAVGADGWIYACTALAAVGEKTAVYGGNPVTYQTAAVSPLILPSEWGSRLTVNGEKISRPSENPYETATLLFSQLKARLTLMGNATPTVVPWMEAEFSAPLLKAWRESAGSEAPYILYSADGTYTF